MFVFKLFHGTHEYFRSSFSLFFIGMFVYAPSSSDFKEFLEILLKIARLSNTLSKTG